MTSADSLDSFHERRDRAPGESTSQSQPGAARAPLWVLCQVADGTAPRARFGDVDPNGDVVDALRPGGRLRRLYDAVGEFVADDVNVDEHVESVVRLLKGVGAW